MKYLSLIAVILLVGCAAGAKLSGTNIVTPYGTANSINGEAHFNAGQ